MDSPTVRQPPTRKELSQDTEFGTVAITSGAVTGAIVGSAIPGFGTVIGAYVGAGLGAFIGIIKKEAKDNKKPEYQALPGSEQPLVNCESDDEE
uniref:Glycine zipper domain-containing protein n=1 Tax=Panagrolaimus sp. PS1159 TaxID=55785 RepID=A0AC35F841_9BILA